MTDLRLGSMIVEDTGGGPPVVMIHGLGGSSNSFETLMGYLDTFRVLRPDLPGAGRSAARPGRPGLPGLAAAVAEALRAAGIPRAHFVGHSMGTLICQYLAVSHPETVASLALFGPILEPSEAARAALADRAAAARESAMAGIADRVAHATLARSVQTASPVSIAFVRESLMRQPPGGYAEHCLALSRAEAARHAAIRCPTLLIAGAQDPVAPVETARRLSEQIVGARLEIIPDIGHWIMVEAPQRSAEILRAHLSQTPL